MSKIKQLFSVILFWAFLCFGCSNSDNTWQGENVIIDIQPYAGFSKEMTENVASEIQKIYPNVKINNAIPLPISAYYKPRNRYRADSLIRFLKSSTLSGHVTIGLTHNDISTTSGEIKDWGVMGLGYRPGNACVVSTFRLKKEKLSSQFYKVCIHELGHTAGLDHCTEKTCFMRDAEGGNPIDEETEFCKKCRKFLVDKSWNLKE